MKRTDHTFETVQGPSFSDRFPAFAISIRGWPTLSRLKLVFVEIKKLRLGGWPTLFPA